MFNQNKIKMAVIAVTYKCNSRCKMCNIWKKELTEELSPSVYKNLPKNIEEVNLTGGEPFLRDDLLEIVDTVFLASNPQKIVIPSNGMLTDRILKFAREALTKPYYDRLTIAISLDAVGIMHDEIRGVPGAFDMVMKTVSSLLEINFTNIGFGYTFVQGNEDEHDAVYELSKKFNINFGTSYFHTSDNYFSNQNTCGPDIKKVECQLKKNIDKSIVGFSKNSLGKSYYLFGLLNFAKNKKRILPCSALTDSFFVDPLGDLYPCNVLTDKVGNIKEEKFSKLWKSKKAEEIRNKVGNCPSPCWMVCTAKPAIKEHWIRAGMWILKSKLKMYYENIANK